MSQSTPSAASEFSRARVMLVMTALLLGTVLASLDSSFMPLAFPNIIKDLNSSTSEVVWVALGYLIAATGPMLLASRFADVYGHARVFQVGSTLYAVAMTACAWAPNVPTLIGVRLIQGLGMALFLPTTFTIATRLYGPGERGRALGLLQSANAVGFILGPIFAGWLLDAYDWRATFASRIPLAALTVILGVGALGFSDPISVPSASRRFDFLGAVWLTLALYGILDGCTRLPVEHNHLDPLRWLIFLGGFLCLGGFIWHERRAPAPLMDLSLFSGSAQFTRAAIAFTAMFASLPLTLFVLPIVLINGLEIRAWDVGGLMAISAAFTTLMSPFSGRAADRWRPEVLSTVGTLVRACGYLLLLRAAVSSQWYDFVPALVLIGVGTGLFFSPNNALLLSHAPPEKAGMVSALFGTLRQGGYALGFAVIASLFTTIQTVFERKWAYTSLSSVPAPLADRLAEVFDSGGAWSPDMLIFILKICVLVCTGILGISVVNSWPRLSMGAWRQGMLVGGLTLATALGIYALSEMPGAGALVLQAASAPTATSQPPVAPFGFARRLAVEVKSPGVLAGDPFALYCSGCHGEHGQGLPQLGADLRHSTFVHSTRSQDLAKFLAVGRPAEAPANRSGRTMPAFAWLDEATRLRLADAVRGFSGEPVDGR